MESRLFLFLVFLFIAVLLSAISFSFPTDKLPRWIAVVMALLLSLSLFGMFLTLLGVALPTRFF